MSINDTKKNRGRGRPPKDTKQIGVRLEGSLLSLLDDYIVSKSDIKNRPDAIRHILSKTLSKGPTNNE